MPGDEGCPREQTGKRRPLELAGKTGKAVVKEIPDRNLGSMKFNYKTNTMCLVCKYVSKCILGVMSTTDNDELEGRCSFNKYGFCRQHRRLGEKSKVGTKSLYICPRNKQPMAENLLATWVRRSSSTNGNVGDLGGVEENQKSSPIGGLTKFYGGGTNALWPSRLGFQRKNFFSRIWNKIDSIFPRNPA